MMRNDMAVIMAGGAGMYLKSGMPPVMAEIMGKPMVARAAAAAVNARARAMTIARRIKSFLQARRRTLPACWTCWTG